MFLHYSAKRGNLWYVCMCVRLSQLSGRLSSLRALMSCQSLLNDNINGDHSDDDGNNN